MSQTGAIDGEGLLPLEVETSLVVLNGYPSDDDENETIEDTIENYPSDSLEHFIFKIANNQYQVKPELTTEELLDKLLELNPSMDSEIESYRTSLASVKKYYYEEIDDEEPICEWSKEQIQDYIKEYIDDLEEYNIDKILAVLQRANKLHTSDSNSEGYELREVQILSLLMYLNSDANIKGALLEIHTGKVNPRLQQHLQL